MKRWILRGVIALVLLLPSLVLAQAKAQPGLVIESGRTLISDVATVAQPIVIDGVVEGDVTSILGSIIVRGSVEGDVVSLFGDVTFEPQSAVEGQVMAAMGTVALPESVQHAPAAAIFSGNLANQGMANLLPGNHGQQLGTLDRFTVVVALGLIGIVIAALLALIWPRSIAAAARALALAPDRAAGLGLLWIGLEAIMVGAVALVCMITLIGMPLLPVLMLVAQVPFLVGLTVVAQTLGERLGVRGVAAVPAGALLLLIPAVSLALLSLLVAFAYFFIVGSVGIGGLILLRVSVAYRHSLQA